MDRLSTLPIGIIETILCLLPIQEAGRTSILSKDWRHRWSKIPKLAFIEKEFRVSTQQEVSVLNETSEIASQRKSMTSRSKFLHAIYQVLLMHEGPIREFSLEMLIDRSCFEMDHIMLHLSKRNTLKILRLELHCVLSISLLSLHQLTELSLTCCTLDFDIPHSFNGFVRLTNLYLEGMPVNGETLISLLSGCPLLKRLALYCCDIDPMGYTIVDLFKCLLVIEHLSLLCDLPLAFYTERCPKQLPTALVHLKYLFMGLMCFNSHPRLSVLFLLIKSSPNLEKLKIREDECETASVKLDEHSDFMLEHLNELEIDQFGNNENGFEFIKLILANSPALKEVRITFSKYMVPKVDPLRISQILFGFPCASPAVEVTISESSSDSIC